MCLYVCEWKLVVVVVGVLMVAKELMLLSAALEVAAAAG